MDSFCTSRVGMCPGVSDMICPETICHVNVHKALKFVLIKAILSLIRLDLGTYYKDLNLIIQAILLLNLITCK